MDLLESLNTQQKAAVRKTQGPLLILAGAGAGKTRVVTHRIAHLIAEGAPPESILAVTFTNKAAQEMRERVINLLDKDPSISLSSAPRTVPFVSTFHSLGVHILRSHASRISLPRHFTIFDRNDSTKAVRAALEKTGFDPKHIEPRKVLGSISRQKGAGVSLAEFQETAERDYYTQTVANVWEAYEAILAKEKACDFDDLLLRTMRLLKNNQDIREHYQRVWHYVHVDEYQDTSPVQYELVRLLTGPHNNICVVGDIDQNIYSWRGADIEHIFAFEREFPNVETILLEQNYRSTKMILDVANDIIKKNKRRKEKNLFTENETGEPITLYCAYDERDEARQVVERAQTLIESGVEPKDIAVLYRANFQSRALEDMFLFYSVPYRVIGTKFFERKEVKDIASFLRAALNPESMTDIKRIINVPPRGIGKITLLKLFEGKRNTLTPATAEKVDAFYGMLASIRMYAKDHKPSEVIKHIIKTTGLEMLYKKGGTEDDIERLENMYELVTLASRFDTLPLGEGLEKFLDDVALATDQDSLDKTANAVHLMTVHAAKGLEFDYVFIVGLEEGLFPHERFDDTDGRIDHEEERRLFYVALTRARKQVFLSYAQTRMIYGSRQSGLPSTFITDIDETKMELADEVGAFGKTVYLE